MNLLKKLFLFSVSFLSIFNQTQACTAFQIRSQDGAQIYSRSMEFGIVLDSNLLVVPRGTEYIGTATDNKPGLKWTVKYGHVGMNQDQARAILSDGLNEKGLVVSALYLPGFSQYEETKGVDNQKILSSVEVVSYLLGTCSTIQEARMALGGIVVGNIVAPVVNFVLPLHYYITDRSGGTLIVEYVGGKRFEHDNPLGVLTNSPPFSWQTINLSNFVNLSPVNVKPLSLSQFTADSLGQGSGLIGIPGDYTPPSRFVRAALYSQWATPGKTAEETVCQGFHILNTFDIFEGIVRQETTDSNAGKDSELTQWTVVHDLSNLKTYFRGYDSLNIQMVDLKKIDFTKTGLLEIPMNTTFVVEDSTGNGQVLNSPKDKREKTVTSKRDVDSGSSRWYGR